MINEVMEGHSSTKSDIKKLDEAIQGVRLKLTEHDRQFSRSQAPAWE
ncbi:MAG: hypothetical protein Q7U38_14120 [Methylobacter sp.]|nr:hypothetical protein [Methylobacter sp.]MDP3362044.1 hypothetical protein [Methylobacter sp.]